MKFIALAALTSTQGALGGVAKVIGRYHHRARHELLTLAETTLCRLLRTSNGAFHPSTFSEIDWASSAAIAVASK